ncbi:hypothetical protein K432DRAFT_461968 [Lepidopterella palustris CBS 459.81]|uniref:Aquaporin-like protein n=1 Tax=Lepidopterella palustris CBS 459.81 TaxID=1314670 RepID=A0A8E2JBX1_9PEZI|nr:hypothetical protein K432DRAFT_461968 [Lepidopterella palustris CBS 459.81]
MRDIYCRTGHRCNMCCVDSFRHLQRHDLKLRSQAVIRFHGYWYGFFPLPAPCAIPVAAFFTFTSVAVMSGTVLDLSDDSNAPHGAGMHAFILNLVDFAMASTLGYNTGPQTNLAKDIAARLIPYGVGYGGDMSERVWWTEAWTAAIFRGFLAVLSIMSRYSRARKVRPIIRESKGRRRERERWGRGSRRDLLEKRGRRRAKRSWKTGIFGSWKRDLALGHQLGGH